MNPAGPFDPTSTAGILYAEVTSLRAQLAAALAELAALRAVAEWAGSLVVCDIGSHEYAVCFAELEAVLDRAAALAPTHPNPGEGGSG